MLGKIKSKEDALMFLKAHKEFTDNSWVDGELWFRYDGVKDCHYEGILIKGHDYTICHETRGYIGVSEAEAVDYVYRNRKRINNIEKELEK